MMARNGQSRESERDRSDTTLFMSAARLLAKRSTARHSAVEKVQRLVDGAALDGEALACAGVNRALERGLRDELGPADKRLGRDAWRGRRRAHDRAAAVGALGDNVGEHLQVCQVEDR